MIHSELRIRRRTGFLANSCAAWSTENWQFVHNRETGFLGSVGELDNWLSGKLDFWKVSANWLSGELMWQTGELTIYTELIMSDKKYLLKDLALNLETSCSVDEAIGMMLGILKGANWYLDVDHENSRTEYERETGNEPDDTFDLSGCLAAMRNQLQWAYWNAEEVKEPLEEHLTAIETFDTDYMKKAKVYLCLVEDELAKGDQSQLRTLTNEHGVKRITLASLDEWWATKQKANHLEQSIFQDMQHNVPPVTSNEEEDAELSLNDKVTFGLLLRAFVKQSIGDKYGKPEAANHSAVKDALIKLLDDALCVKAHHTQSNRSITSRLAAAENALNDYIAKNS